jgi:hypothetical protein
MQPRGTRVFLTAGITSMHPRSHSCLADTRHAQDNIKRRVASVAAGDEPGQLLTAYGMSKPRTAFLESDVPQQSSPVGSGMWVAYGWRVGSVIRRPSSRRVGSPAPGMCPHAGGVILGVPEVLTKRVAIDFSPTAAAPKFARQSNSQPKEVLRVVAMREA